MALDYSPEKLRVYIIDDASTDNTPLVVIDKSKIYHGRVFHIRRVAGGEGRAHTLNYGLETLWKNSWTEAVLIMDADVIYTPKSLKQMARHLTDPTIGAVTAYIKEGSAKPNSIQRYVGFEYITATGASRRAQNVLGFLACLSGGAQLHSRENLQNIGGQIFSHTLAEDTFTTFRTQLSGKRAIFEPNAIVYAEEPDDLRGLWKQRVRWGRGNVQITRVFKNLWLNRGAHMNMGSFSMSLLWFSIVLMPFLQIGAAVALVTLFFTNAALAWQLFRGFWIVATSVYLIVTAVSCAVDPESAKRTWVEGILFPGLVSLGVIVYSLFPFLFDSFIPSPIESSGFSLGSMFWLFMYSWLALSMLASYCAMLLEESKGIWSHLSKPLLLLGGYGPFLCAVTAGSYLKEWLGAEMKWDKTVKTGKVS